jgi:membrane-associated phospholipid phosphatase
MTGLRSPRSDARRRYGPPAVAPHARSLSRAVFRPLAVAAISASLAVSAAAQNCGWSRIDHRVGYDASGVWNPGTYRGIVGALTLAQIGGAVWEGADSRFGRTMWQGIDAQIVSGASVAAGKRLFTRVRPSTEDNPCLWFEGGSNYSFPSGEAAGAAALVAPYVLEYGRDDPATYALLLLPLYVGVARIRNQAHWQTDVLAGWTVGALSGWYAHARAVPILIELLPHGVAVGLRRQF